MKFFNFLIFFFFFTSCDSLNTLSIYDKEEKNIDPFEAFEFKDIFSENGKSINLPTLKQYDSYSASHPLSILFVLEANFDFAYVAKAQCSRRKLILF